MTRSLRLAFMGTPDFAVPALDALVAAGHAVVAVYSQPPRPARRGHRVQPSPVHARAEALGIEVRTPRSFRDPADVAAFQALDLDAAVVAAYGLILPPAILAAPRLGCLNIHASLLPRWRGAAPIQRAILAGDAETGVTIMAMDEGLDTGAMLVRDAVPIAPDATATDIHDALSLMGARLIVDALDGLAEGHVDPVPQPEEGVTYAAKLTREDGRILWGSAEAVDRQVRALTPWPGTWFDHGEDRLKVLAVERAGPTDAPAGTVIDDRLTVACGDGTALRVTRLQRPGKPPMAAEDLLRGYAIPAGTRLPAAAV